MKMVIVEVKKRTAVALEDDGTFVRLRQCGYKVGQTVETADGPKTSRFFPRVAAACIAAVILLGGSGALAARYPYSYVTMDVNPSIKYTLNVFDRVLSVQAVDRDADVIVDALEKEGVANSRLDDAIEMAVSQCRTDDYLYDGEEDYVVLSVASVSDGKTSELSEQLGSAAFGGGLITAEIVPTTIPEMKEAENRGTTPGKLELISRMQKQSGDTQSPEKWIDAPVREIVMAANGDGSGTRNNGAGSKEASGSGQDVPNAEAVRPPQQTSGETEAGSQDAQAPQSSQGQKDVAAGLQNPQNTRQTQRASSGESSPQAPEAASQDGTGTQTVQSPSGTGEADRQPDAQTGDDRGQTQKPAEAQSDASADSGSDSVEAAIAALSDEDREALSAYIETYRDAVAAEQEATANPGDGQDPSACSEAAAQALSALQEAAESRGIDLGVSQQPEGKAPEAGKNQSGSETAPKGGKENDKNH